MILAATLALAASVAWVLGTTLGYSRFIALRARTRAVRCPPNAPTAPQPHVAVIVATRESAAVVLARVQDLRKSDYPSDLVSIVVGADASIAPHALGEIHRSLATVPDCRVVSGHAPGKASALNAAVAAADCQVLMFADSHQRFPPQLISELVQALDTPGVGAATGLVATPEDDSFSASYWKGEQQVREYQSAYHSVICVTGAVYAMRRVLFTPIPDGTICDDLFATMTLTSSGHRVVLVPTAIALDARRFSGVEQYRRRVRTMTGLLQLLRVHPHWLSPSRNPMWFDLLIHKANRLVLPWVVVFGGVAGVVLAWQLAILLPAGLRWSVAVLGASVIAAGSVLVLRSRALRERLDGVLRAFMVPIVALSNGLRGRWNVWTPVPHAHLASSRTTES